MCAKHEESPNKSYAGVAFVRGFLMFCSNAEQPITCGVSVKNLRHFRYNHLIILDLNIPIGYSQLWANPEWLLILTTNFSTS
jgi:hypothetical protein